MPGTDLAQQLAAPATFWSLTAICCLAAFVLWRELRRVQRSLLVLMATAFVDMLGVLVVAPLLPFYVRRLAPDGVDALGLHFGVGQVNSFVVSSFTLAQLVSAPFWGRFSDRFGRRPALLVALATSTIAYVLFGFADSLWLLAAGRLLQGAGGGTVPVIQAYVADSAAPGERARALGWLSAATNLGVMLGPVLGWFGLWLAGTAPAALHGPVLGWSGWLLDAARIAGDSVVTAPGGLRHAAPGILAAAICAANLLFAWRCLPESRAGTADRKQHAPPMAAMARVLVDFRDRASRLIWIYALAIGAFQGTFAVLALWLERTFHVDETRICYVFVFNGALSVIARAWLLGPMLARFREARLSRLGVVVLTGGLVVLPFAHDLPTMALGLGLMPLGTAFTFPAVTGLLSRVVAPADRGLYMGLQQTFGGATRVAMPLLYGWLFDHAAAGTPWWVAAGIVLLTLPLSMGLQGIADAPKPSAEAPKPPTATR